MELRRGGDDPSGGATRHDERHQLPATPLHGYSGRLEFDAQARSAFEEGCNLRGGVGMTLFTRYRPTLRTLLRRSPANRTRSAGISPVQTGDAIVARRSRL